MRFLPRRTARPLLLAAALASGAACGGCHSNQLETGYSFTPIGSPTSAQRRAYFANPFSPEARAAQMDAAQSGYDRGNRSGN